MNSEKSSLTLIADPNAESGALESLPPTPGLEILTRQELLESGRKFSLDDKVICTSESILDVLLPALSKNDTRIQAVSQMKDKHLFRKLVSPIFPDFLFQELNPTELKTLGLDPEKKYVLKPNKGCFGTGVHIFQGGADLEKLGTQIQKEIAANKSVLSDSVLSEDSLILEEYIEGEEYAVDVFFDAAGKVIITNIYHHPIPKNRAYLHMLYYSSASVHAKIATLAIDFFQQFSQQLDLRLMPIHSEFRYSDGRLVPIEMNPMRFGGMGLTNLGIHTLGSNAYSAVIDEIEPDWSSLWRGREDIANIFLIAYNGTDVDKQKQAPNWPSFRKNFSDIRKEISFDYQQQLAFGILYLQEPLDSIQRLLSLEFNDYFPSIT